MNAELLDFCSANGFRFSEDNSRNRLKCSLSTESLQTLRLKKRKEELLMVCCDGYTRQKSCLKITETTADRTDACGTLHNVDNGAIVMCMCAFMYAKLTADLV